MLTVVLPPYPLELRRLNAAKLKPSPAMKRGNGVKPESKLKRVGLLDSRSTRSTSMTLRMHTLLSKHGRVEKPSKLVSNKGMPVCNQAVPRS